MKVTVRNLKPVQDFIAKVPRGTIRVALEAISKYILGDERHGLKHNEPYKYKSRKAAYGSVSSDGAPDGYFSMKQFRYVAAITKGFTMRGSHRTDKTSNAWKLREVQGGYGQVIENPLPSAFYTRDDDGQARQPALVGWRKVAKVVQDNMKGAIKSGYAAIKKWLAENRTRR